MLIIHFSSLISSATLLLQHKRCTATQMRHTQHFLYSVGIFQFMLLYSYS